jgi:hypothetical protein
LELELRQREQDEQIISSFEQIYNKLAATFVETVQSDFCAKLRDIENVFFNKALQVRQRHGCSCLRFPKHLMLLLCNPGW